MALTFGQDLTVAGNIKLTDVDKVAGAYRTIPSSSFTASLTNTPQRLEHGQILYVESENKLLKVSKVTDESFNTTITYPEFTWPGGGGGGTTVSANPGSSGGGALTTIAIAGTNYSVSAGGGNPFDQDLDTTDSPTFTGMTAKGNVVVEGMLIAKDYIISSSVTYMTQSFSSGSTIFGDTLDDTHQFTGSILIGSGSISGSHQSTGSFGILRGDGSQLTGITTDVFSDGSANKISGSSISTGSFGLVLGDGSQLTNLPASFTPATISGSLGANASLIRGLTASIISGSSTILSASLSTRVKTLEEGSTFTASSISGSFNVVSASLSASIADLEVDSGSFSTRIQSLEGNSAFTAADISGSLGVNANLIRSLTAVNISGSFGASSASFSTRTTDLEGTMVSEQTNIDNLQTDSGSFSTRVTQATASIAHATASIANLVTRITTEETNVDNLQTDSGSFQSRITVVEGNVGGQALNTSDSPTFAGMTVEGTLTAKQYIVSSSVTHMTQSFSSGSTIFGDTTDDIHQFTGSILVGSGSISGSHQSTGSFGRIDVSDNITATSFDGIFNGALSSSAQISNDISGSFTAPSASISTRLTTAESELSNTLVSSSAQIASDISGSFSKEHLSSKIPNIVSSSAQIASDISGSYNPRVTVLEGSGTIQGVGTGNDVEFNKITVDGNVTASGHISGSITSTGSFGKLLGDGSSLSGINVGVFTTIDSDNSKAIKNLQTTGSFNVTGSLSVKGDSFTYKATTAASLLSIYDNDDSLVVKVGKGLMVLGAQATAPAPEAGGFFYSGSGSPNEDDFYLGFE